MSMLRQTLSSPIGQPEPIGIASQLCQALEDDIVSGQLAPGTRLEEPLLAKRFGVSRTPVREALQLLTATELAEKSQIEAYMFHWQRPNASRQCSKAWQNWKGHAGGLLPNG